MRKIKRIPITQEGFDALRKKLQDLKNMRPQAVETLSDARKMGDLSENGLYSAAKMRLRSIDSQIFRLTIQIRLADIILDLGNDVVRLGSRVTISDGEKTRTFHIVGHYEADPLSGKISSLSPIGKGLMRKKVGDKGEIITPQGKTTFTILQIQ